MKADKLAQSSVFTVGAYHTLGLDLQKPLLATYSCSNRHNKYLMDYPTTENNKSANLPPTLPKDPNPCLPDDQKPDK